MRTSLNNVRIKILINSVLNVIVNNRYISAIVIIIHFSTAIYIQGRTYTWHHLTEYNCITTQHDSLNRDSLRVFKIAGKISNNFHENIDSVKVVATTDRWSKQIYSDKSGSFSLFFQFDSIAYAEKIDLLFIRYDYYPFDTNIVITNQDFPETLSVILIPKYKILLRGRLFAGNTLLEDVNVDVRHGDELRHLKTMNCYTDEENYWNCLYLGMFKTEIVSDNPEDSIYLSFSKSGFKPQSYELRFADYSGDILKFRMKYADTIPDLPYNNLNLKLTYPLGKNSGWFLGLSFYRKLNSHILDRFRPGMEISLSSYERSTSLSTLPGFPETKFDTLYTNFFIGPSFLFFLTKPYIRKFSTYLGSTLSIGIDRGEIVLQPFLGSRYFIDMRKSICIDFRYISYSLNAKEYFFTYNGNALSSNENVNVKRMLINVGVQINF